MIHPESINWPAGLSVGVFLAEYWQRKPLLIRNAFPDFENPLSPDELGGLALDEDINSRLVLKQSDVRWHMQTGPFSEEDLTSLPAKDWSLLVSDIEKHLDGFHQYLRPFRFVPDWQIDDLMISYAPAGASVGAHIDEYDVFLMQASGKREWFIDTRADTDRRFLPDLEIKILQNFDPDASWVLEPGDLLYLPPSVPHHGVSMDNECMTWSIGFRAVDHSSLVKEIARQISEALPDTARYRDTATMVQSHPGEITRQTLDDLRSIWNQLTDIDSDEFNRLAGNVLTQRTDAFINDNFTTEEWQPVDSLDSLFVNNHVARDAASRLCFISTPDFVFLHANGERYPVSHALACLLCDSYSYENRSLLEHAVHNQNAQCLLALGQRGILTPGN